VPAGRQQSALVEGNAGGASSSAPIGAITAAEPCCADHIVFVQFIVPGWTTSGSGWITMPWRRQAVAPQMGVTLPAVRLLGNVIWFALAGFWLFTGYAFAALLYFVFIVTIPFGVAALRIALFGIWPFGRAIIPQAQKGVDPRLVATFCGSCWVGGTSRFSTSSPASYCA
jgi:hypothetical protein